MEYPFDQVVLFPRTALSYTQIEEKLMWYAFFCTVWVTNEVEIEQVLQKLTITLTVTDFRFVITNNRSMLTIF